MDPAALFKWDTRTNALPTPPQLPPQNRLFDAVGPPLPPPRLSELEEFFKVYGIRCYTATRIGELGFTVNTLLNMKDEELDEMMNGLSHIFRWELLVGERYGIKAAVRAERRRLLDHYYNPQRQHFTINSLDAQEGLSEELVQQQRKEGRSSKQQRGNNGRSRSINDNNNNYDEESDDEDENGGSARQREHPFIVTEPNEVARGKKNGLDYLFDLYEQCRDFLVQVQNIAKESGEKCPTKVTNQVFRYAKEVAGAKYINKPKMRHYVHCYALHCLDQETSNALRRAYKERGENVGAWRQACYSPLVAIASRQGWDIDAIFNTNPRLCIWYVPTKLRQLCHAQRSSAAAATSNATSVNYF